MKYFAAWKSNLVSQLISECDCLPNRQSEQKAYQDLRVFDKNKLKILFYGDNVLRTPYGRFFLPLHKMQNVIQMNGISR